MPTFTPFYGFNLPLVNDPTDEDQWGGLLNENFSDLDTIVKAVSDATYTLVTAKTTNYTILATDRNYLLTMDATAGTRTFTLPAPSVGNGWRVAVKKIDASTNPVNIIGTVDGLSKSLLNQWDFLVFVTDGTSWFQVGGQSLVGPTGVTNGFIVNRAYVETIAQTIISANIPTDGTIPQITEGTQILTINYTPSSITNILRLTLSINGFSGAATSAVGCVFQGSGPNAIMIAPFTMGGNFTATSCVQYEYVPATVSAITFTVRAGTSSGAWALNTALYGNVDRTTLVIEEIKA